MYSDSQSPPHQYYYIGSEDNSRSIPLLMRHGLLRKCTIVPTIWRMKCLPQSKALQSRTSDSSSVHPCTPITPLTQVRTLSCQGNDSHFRQQQRKQTAIDILTWNPPSQVAEQVLHSPQGDQDGHGPSSHETTSCCKPSHPGSPGDPPIHSLKRFCIPIPQVTLQLSTTLHGVHKRHCYRCWKFRFR